MFCTKCGKRLPDDANFCEFCGSPTAAPNPVYTSPEIDAASSAQDLYQSPVINPVTVPDISDSDTETAHSGVSVAAVPENTAAYAQPADFSVVNPPVADFPADTPAADFSAVDSPVADFPVVDTPAADFSAVNSAAPENAFHSDEISIQNTQESIPAMNTYYQAAASQNPFGQNQANQNPYSQTDYGQSPFAQNPTAANQNPFGQPQVNVNPYPDNMGGMPDGSQAWGPLMPPKKKSKAPIIIALSSILLLITAAIVICCLVFCGGKDGAGSAEDALKDCIQAYSENDTDEILDSLHPLFDVMLDKLDDVKSEYVLEASVVKSQFISSVIQQLSPEPGKTFTYSNLKISSTETLSKDDIDEYNDSMEEQFETYSDAFDEIGLDLGKISDYKVEAAAKMDGTVKINGEKCDLTAVAAKIKGSWYITYLSVQ